MLISVRKILLLQAQGNETIENFEYKTLFTDAKGILGSTCSLLAGRAGDFKRRFAQRPCQQSKCLRDRQTLFRRNAGECL